MKVLERKGVKNVDRGWTDRVKSYIIYSPLVLLDYIASQEVPEER